MAVKGLRSIEQLKSVAGAFTLLKFGYNGSANTTEVTCWNKNVNYPWSTLGDWDDATGLTIQVVSDDTNDDGASSPAGTGARTVRAYGLGPGGVLQTEDVTLNGTTPVVLTKKWTRMHRARVRTAGSGGKNAGTIDFEYAGTSPNTTIASIPALSGRTTNQTTQATFTVPAGYNMIITEIDVGAEATVNAVINTYVLTRSPGEGVFRQAIPDLVVPSYGSSSFEPGMMFPQGTDVDMRTKWEATGGAVSCHFHAVLTPRADATAAQKSVAISNISSF